MVGDSLSDMLFAKNAGILPVHAGTIRYPEFDEILTLTKYHFDSLYDFAKYLDEKRRRGEEEKRN
jgi:phosphoglycolate phosphatase-like HAD superfamily hydrolase